VEIPDAEAPVVSLSHLRRVCVYVRPIISHNKSAQVSRFLIQLT